MRDTLPEQLQAEATLQTVVAYLEVVRAARRASLLSAPSPGASSPVAPTRRPSVRHERLENDPGALTLVPGPRA